MLDENHSLGSNSWMRKKMSQNQTFLMIILRDLLSTSFENVSFENFPKLKEQLNAIVHDELQSNLIST